MNSIQHKFTPKEFARKHNRNQYNEIIPISLMGNANLCPWGIS